MPEPISALTLALIMGGTTAGGTLMNKFIPGAGGNGMQIPGAQSPNLGQTLMSQKPMMATNDIYPKPQGTQPQANGSILGNSLYNNPYMMNQRFQRRY